MIKIVRAESRHGTLQATYKVRYRLYTDGSPEKDKKQQIFSELLVLQRQHKLCFLKVGGYSMYHFRQHEDNLHFDHKMNLRISYGSQNKWLLDL